MRAEFADHFGDSVFEVFRDGQTRIGKAQIPPDPHPQNSRRPLRFTKACLGGATRSGLALS